LVIHPVRLVGDAIKALIQATASELGPVRVEATEYLPAQLDQAEAALIVCAVANREDAASVMRHVTAHPTRRLVVMIDHADGEIVARLVDSGVRGIITGATTGAVALSVLRLVLAGGVYVPQTHGLAEAQGGMHGAPRRAMSGDSLTRRQRQVLRELGGGLTNRAIAQRLGMQESTVKAHVKQIIKRLGVDNRTQAALIAAGRATSLPVEG
jgi:DNA-binding NarL/FixJ family response regulator